MEGLLVLTNQVPFSDTAVCRFPEFGVGFFFHFSHLLSQIANLQHLLQVCCESTTVDKIQQMCSAYDFFVFVLKSLSKKLFSTREKNPK